MLCKIINLQFAHLSLDISIVGSFIFYGEYENNYNNDTVQRIDYELMKMAARGITVIVASGNNGVNCASDSRQQQPVFPTSSYMTLGNQI
jgi:subtilase family serine protease